jgi:hypothetical protein
MHKGFSAAGMMIWMRTITLDEILRDNKWRLPFNEFLYKCQLLQKLFYFALSKLYSNITDS